MLVVAGSRVRELPDKSKNTEKKTVLFWEVVFFCFTMKWSLQKVASVRKSGKLVMEKKKKSEYKLNKRVARLSGKNWHFGSNLEQQPWASGLQKIYFLSAKLEW